MSNLSPYRATTRGIAVSVEPVYVSEHSSPSESKYVWSYRVTIENGGGETVQLRSRHWRIADSRGAMNEVKGPGVIGKQPVLKPGGVFQYSSWVPLNTPSGLMMGTYQIETESNEVFDIEIPVFSLDSPHQLTHLN